MPVTVQLESRDGGVLLYCPSATATEHLLGFAGDETPTLDKIDIYDDMVLPAKTLPLLVAEAERVVKRMPSDKRQEDAMKVVEFFREAMGLQEAAHVRFIGD